jgi:hypothetical protein
MRLFAGFAALSLCLSAAPAAAQSLEGDLPPAPPPGAAPNLALPAVDADGNYETPNRHLNAAEAVWHLRAALNVAALGCRGPHGTQVVAAYNAMLNQHAAVFAKANDGVDASYRIRYGVRWLAARETDMTKTYNFFAQPPAQADFCPIAEAVLSEVADIRDEDMADFAAARMRALEAPFLNFYARYAAYRVAVADWRARATRVALATVAAVPMTAAAPR